MYICIYIFIITTYLNIFIIFNYHKYVQIIKKFNKIQIYHFINIKYMLSLTVSKKNVLESSNKKMHSEKDLLKFDKTNSTKNLIRNKIESENTLNNTSKNNTTLAIRNLKNVKLIFN